MTKFRNINGKNVPITPKKGGVVIAAATVACGMVAVNGGFGAGSAGTSADSLAGQSMRAKSGSGKSAARNGRYDQAWKRLGWKQLNQKAEPALECTTNSYGQVREFFVTTPCRSLDRMLLAVNDANGNTIVISIAWVRMYGTGQAERLKELVDDDGTGSVSPRAAAALDFAGARFTGAHYYSDRNKGMTVIAEAAPAKGNPDGEVMDLATEIAVEFPPP